jgi:hypothetical protein
MSEEGCMEGIKLGENILVISKKYYAGGEITTELIMPENKDIHCQVIITHKKGDCKFELGAKYALLFMKEGGDGE